MILRKRIFILVLLVTVVMLNLWAGGGSAASKGSQTAQDRPASVTFWHTWGAPNHPNKPVVDEVKAFLENKYKIKVEDDTSDLATYQVKLSVAYSANEAPDIARGWSLATMAPFVAGNKLLALDNYMTADFKAKLLPNATDNMTFNGKIYGLPMGINTQSLFVNRVMFQKEGLPLPTDWDKLTAAIRHFKSKGIVPMALGAKLADQLTPHFDILKLRAVGPVDATRVLRKEIDYSAPEFLVAVEKLKELIDMGAFSPAAAGMNRDEAEIDVFNGKVPMYFQGNWVVAQYYMASSLVSPDDIEILSFPAWNGAKGKVTDITGAIGDAFYVNANSKYPQFHTEVMQDMCYQFAKGLYVRGTGLPAYNIPEVDASKLLPLFLKMVAFTNGASSVTNYTSRIYSGEDNDQYNKIFDSLLIGASTPRQVIEQLNAISRNK